MLKSDLINILVVKRGVTQKQAESTIETIFDSMKDALCRGENIEIRGLGAFHVKHYDGYQGRNPKTGEVIPVKPKRGILFRTPPPIPGRTGVRAASRSRLPFAGATACHPSWAGHMIRATAPVNFLHFDSSATSCFLPAAVSR